MGKVQPAHARRKIDIHNTNQLVDTPTKQHLLSWGLTLFVTAIAALVRWPRLGIPNDVVFDETYYVKDAYALLKNGYEREAVEKANEFLLQGRTDLYETVGSFVAHPPMGKWIIAIGQQLFGLNSFGWRFGVAVMGTLLVLVTTRVAIRLLRSIWFGSLAGFLLAIDGLAIVMSRTALLDGIMATFVMMGVGCLLLDRDRTRSLLSRKLKENSAFGGRFTWHPWRIGAGIFLGLAIATKWSALYYLVAIGILTLLWEYSFKKIRRARKPFMGTFFIHSWWAAIQLIVPAFLVYLGSWTGWFRTEDGWGRNPENPGLLNALRSLLNYHEQIWNFHINLSDEHSYEAYALGWPILYRPTSFFYQENLSNCASSNCAQEVLAIGNPIIWWMSVLALILLLINFLRSRNWRSGTIVFLFLAGWAPWLLLPDRTMFYFYSVVFVPFLVIAIAYIANLIYLGVVARESSRKAFLVIGTILLAVIIGVSVFFYPIWAAVELPKDDWLLRMWFSRWI